MGSGFIAYAVILVIMLNVGGDWLARRGCSQELLDSSVITIWVRLLAIPRYCNLGGKLIGTRVSSTPSRSIMEDRGATRICSIL
jgi:hypothetical protein